MAPAGVGIFTRVRIYLAVCRVTVTQVATVSTGGAQVAAASNMVSTSPAKTYVVYSGSSDSIRFGCAVAVNTLFQNFYV